MYIFILNGEKEGERIELSAGSYIFGRSTKANVVLDNDKFVSSKHAELIYNDNETMTINDLGSRNGTYLLGEPVEKTTEVNPGDIIRIGRTFIKISRRTQERYFSADDENTSSTDTIVVVDIVGSSRIAQAMGDRVASKVKNLLFHKLNINLAMYPAEFFKNTGDGFMLIFNKPLDAVIFSTNLLRDLKKDKLAKSFHIRIGIHYGETFKLPDGDRRGLAVDTAFRVESVKIGDMHQTLMGIRKEMLPRIDRIFISEIVNRMIASNSKINTRCIGFFDLKGFTGRHKIFEVII